MIDKDRTCICGNRLNPSDYSDSFNACACKCGSTHFVPRSTLADMNFVYDGSDEKYGSEAYLQGSVLRWSHSVILNYLISVSKNIGKPLRTLEIGCFNGFFVKKLIETGLDSYGTDLNDKAVKIGQTKFYLSARLMNDFDEAIGKGPFDCIILIDVLEHLEKPIQFVQGLIPHLAEQGNILVAGPITERFMLDKSDFPPHHLWRFSRLGLKCFGSVVGLKVMELEIQYDFGLFLRNFIGRVRYGFFSKEYRGGGRSVSNDEIPQQVLKFATFATKLMAPILRILKKPYCSGVFIYSKIPF